MMPSTSSKIVLNSILVSTFAALCLAIVAQAQYNAYDSDSNSDSDGSPILTNAELGKLVRNSAKAQRAQNLYNTRNQQQQLAATRNLYNKQQPLQYAPSQHKRQYGSSESLSGYNPIMGVSQGRGSNANNDDDDEGGNFGSNFGANFDGSDNDGERNANADRQPMNLNQAASGYPGQGDYSENVGTGFGFGGSSGSSSFNPSLDGAEFGPSEGFGSGGRRAKSASSLIGSSNFGSDDDAGASQYGPNSAVNSGENDDEGRAGYAPEGGNDNEGDDD